MCPQSAATESFCSESHGGTEKKMGMNEENISVGSGLVESWFDVFASSASRHCCQACLLELAPNQEVQEAND